MKSKNALSGLALLSLIFWATGLCVSAEPSVENDTRAVLSLKWYREQKTNPAAINIIGLYLKGVGEGLGWANAELKVGRRQQPLFCVPAKLGLRGDNLVDILEQEIERSPTWRDDSQLAFILLRGLMNTFPCPK